MTRHDTTTYHNFDIGLDTANTGGPGMLLARLITFQIGNVTATSTTSTRFTFGIGTAVTHLGRANGCGTSAPFAFQ